MAQNPAPAAGLPTVAITFDGETLNCRAGTSLAVALWDQGIRHLSHSHKFGRPRGVTCARGHCTNFLLRVDGVPNVRSCETPLHDGMVVATQDTGTFYGAPMQKMLALGSAWFPVGFYYKWFTRPATLSRFFLDRIRPMTGVGRLPDAARAARALPAAAEAAATPPQTDLGQFETIVVGAGPSGLRAAAECAGTTLLLDDHVAAGGQRLAALRELASCRDSHLGRFPTLAAALERLEAAVARLPAHDNVRFLGGARAIAGYHPDGVLVRRGSELMVARFKTLVWAAGALDTIGLFPGNDTPGLFGPRALYRLLTRDGLEVDGKHALIVGGGLDFWLSAALLAARGAAISLVVTEGGCQSEVAAAVDLKWALNTGLKLDEVRGNGQHMVQAVFVPRRNAPGPLGSHMHLEADLAVICGRGKPAYDIPYQLGADLALLPERGGFVPRALAASTTGDLELTLPGGARILYAGETLGHLPTDQVSR